MSPLAKKVWRSCQTILKVFAENVEKKMKREKGNLESLVGAGLYRLKRFQCTGSQRTEKS